MLEEKHCRNPACGCPASGESEYCSAVCARGAIGAIAPASCECGHDACRAGAG